MKLEVDSVTFKKQKTDLMVLLLDSEMTFCEVKDPQLKKILEQLSKRYSKKEINKEFSSSVTIGKIRHILVLHTSLITSYDIAEKIKILAARAIDHAKDLGFLHINFLLNGRDASNFIQNVVEGIYLGAYYFDKYRKEKDTFSKKMTVVGSVTSSSLKSCRQQLNRAMLLSECINEARQLVNEPGAAVYPQIFADLARRTGKKHGLRVSVLNERSLKKAGHVGLINVGKGSAHPPRLITLEFRPSKPSKTRLALVGKGITFDTGGISLKPSNRMLEMKGDMAGGAAVLYAMQAIAQLKTSINVLGIIPAAENMPDANAQRPGDILVPKNGKSIQVDNTDAEGRLVMIDGFEKAEEWKATHIIDIATLTGSVVRALGQGYAGIMGNDDNLVKLIIESGKSHGELFWELPLPEEYRNFLKTPYADLNNVGSSYAGAITAGLFLQEFVPEKMNWAHLDIAGPFLFDKPWKYYKAGATGFGLKTFVELCRQLEK